MKSKQKVNVQLKYDSSVKYVFFVIINKAAEKTAAFLVIFYFTQKVRSWMDTPFGSYT